MAKQQHEDQRHRDLSLAWHVEAFARQKKLPSLQSLMKTRRRQQTSTEHRTMLHLLAATYGGSVRPITDATKKALRH